MAFKGVLRPGLIQIRVLNMDEAINHYQNILGLNLVGKESDGRVYFKGWDEFDHHSVVLRQAESAGLDYVAFKVDSNDYLKEIEPKIVAWGLEVDHVPAGEQPGVGARIGFTLPTGHRVELYHEIELAEDTPGTVNPDIYPARPHGMGASRFDHLLCYGPNIGKAREFFCEVLDFYQPEKVDMPEGDGSLAIWLTASNKAHDIAFVEHEEPGKLHHVAFLLQDWNEVGAAADIISINDVSLDIGPTRHGITRGQTIYFFDPCGNRNEVYAGGYTAYPDHPVRTWDFDHVGKGIFYHERVLNDRFLTVLT